MPRRDAGFTLLETLVALMVFALVAAAVQLSLSGGWQALRQADRQAEALDVARDELAAAGPGGRFTVGSEDGSHGPYAWSRTISPHDQGPGAQAAADAPQAYWVTVTVSWREGPRRTPRELTLTTLKLGRAAP